jgi:chromosome segregation ATPase
MEQVFCSESVVIDQRLVLEQIEQELAAISPLCPDGEKTFERLLQLLDKLLTARNEAADKGCDSSESDEDHQSDSLSQVVLQLRHQLEEAKAQIRKSHQQLAEAEDENQKLLNDHSEQSRLMQSLKRQFETLQHQCEDQSESHTSDMHMTT